MVQGIAFAALLQRRKARAAARALNGFSFSYLLEALDLAAVLAHIDSHGHGNNDALDHLLPHR